MKTTIFVLIAAACILGASAFKLPESRIVDGHDATKYQFAYQVALQIRGRDNSYYRCGGALIKEDIVLTAAHCFDHGRTGLASFGSDKYMKGTVIPFNQVIVHEFYDPEYILNDIALAFLQYPVKTDGVSIKVMSLDVGNLVDNKQVTVSGFGNIADKYNDDKLHYVNLTTISNRDCREYFPYLTPTTVCAMGNNRESTCSGDSGSPVVRDWPKGPVHVGIVSYGLKYSCEEGWPSVFTRTASYINWIHENAFSKK